MKRHAFPVSNVAVIMSRAVAGSRGKVVLDVVATSCNPPCVIRSRVRCGQLVTPPGRTREPHRQDDRDAGHEFRPTPSPAPLVDVSRGAESEPALDEAVAVVMLDKDVEDAFKMLVVQSHVRTVVAETAVPRPFSSPTIR